MAVKKRKDAKCVLELKRIVEKINKKTNKLEKVTVKDRITVRKSLLKKANASGDVNKMKIKLKKYNPITRKHEIFMQVKK